LPQIKALQHEPAACQVGIFGWGEAPDEPGIADGHHFAWSIIEPNHGRVTLTRRNRAGLPFMPVRSRMVTLSSGEPARETSIACAVSTLFEL